MFTAFELVNTVKFIAVTFVETGHVITILLAFTPTFVVEWNSNIFIVTVSITTGVIRWMATSCPIDVVQKWIIGAMRFCSDAIHVKTFWTQSPDIKSEKKKENNKKKKWAWNFWVFTFLGLLLLNKFRPVRDLNPWPLRYRCSALPTELTSQLGAGYCVGSE